MNWKLILLFVAGLAGVATGEQLVPGCAAYLEPDGKAAKVTADGISNWPADETRVLWFGEIRNPGELDCSVRLQLPTGDVARLRLTVEGVSHEVEVVGASNVLQASFGRFEIKQAGYVSFILESLGNVKAGVGNVLGLVLNGPAAEGAHFNRKPRRNAASVHLRYPVPARTNVAEFYCEVTAVEDPVTTYYMACGWQRGYFGMQVNSPTERRIIFSVWDSGKEPVNRDKVAEHDRVKLMAKGEGVYAGDFGNEGTGGHSHLKYLWRTGERQRFAVVAQPADKSHTIYSGYYFHPDQKKWMLISSWKAPQDGGWLRGLYSFSENFSGSNGHLRRKALYGNQWIITDGGVCIELTEASFGHDATGREDRLDRFMGVENGCFFLSNGGFVPGQTARGEVFHRPAAKLPPLDLDVRPLTEK